MSDRATTLVIVNPASAGGATHRRWPRIRDLLCRDLDFDVAFSQYPGHALELGRGARARGIGRLVCVGGDGTLHEVVNGAFSGSPEHPMPEIAIIPSGTGSDLARTLGIPLGIEEACARLVSPRKVTSDLGVVSYKGAGGPALRYFVNAAGLGYDAEVVSRRDGFSRYARGTIPYLAAIAVTLLGYGNKDVSVTLDGTRDDRRISFLAVAIGKYFGGGMMIAPDAVLDDGRFDVITVGDVGRLELVYNVPGIYRGAHLRHPKVRVERAGHVQVESEQKVLIQADGELLGLVPAEFQVLPRALTLLC